MKYRKSILQDDLTRCYICNKKNNIEIHHIYFGKNRDNSTKYGCIVALCYEHHRGTNGVHGKNGKKLDLKLKQQCQLYFEKEFDLDFLSIFRRNYL